MQLNVLNDLAEAMEAFGKKTRCWFDAFLHWNSAAEEGAWVILKLDLQGGTRFNLLRIQFWTPVQRKRVYKGVRKWTPNCGKSVAFISS